MCFIKNTYQLLCAYLQKILSSGATCDLISSRIDLYRFLMYCGHVEHHDYDTIQLYPQTFCALIVRGATKVIIVGVDQ